ncbi:hypothetical protein GCM10023115_32840 [Pontixanthobacter gangjinensis]
MLIAFLVVSCGPSTQITGSWTKDDIASKGPYKKVYIAALTPNANAQKALEYNLATAARDRGIEAVTSQESFTRKFTMDNQPSKNEILDNIRAQNADAIFTVTLVDKESETRYVPGSTTYYSPMAYGGYYGSFYSYYNTMYPITYDPGYYATDKIYYLESNLYDADSEELIWSAQSKTVNPSNIDSFARDYTEAMLKELVQDGVLKE